MFLLKLVSNLSNRFHLKLFNNLLKLGSNLSNRFLLKLASDLVNRAALQQPNRITPRATNLLLPKTTRNYRTEIALLKATFKIIPFILKVNFPIIQIILLALFLDL